MKPFDIWDITLSLIILMMIGTACWSSISKKKDK